MVPGTSKGELKSWGPHLGRTKKEAKTYGTYVQVEGVEGSKVQ